MPTICITRLGIDLPFKDENCASEAYEAVRTSFATDGKTDGQTSDGEVITI
jgi:hypothetical protein